MYVQVAFIEPLETLKVEDIEDTPDVKHAWRTISPANEYAARTRSIGHA